MQVEDAGVGFWDGLGGEHYDPTYGYE